MAILIAKFSAKTRTFGEIEALAAIAIIALHTALGERIYNCVAFSPRWLIPVRHMPGKRFDTLDNGRRQRRGRTNSAQAAWAQQPAFDLGLADRRPCGACASGWPYWLV
jgi:hypothetical protein